MISKKDLLISLGLITLGIAFRLFPHPYNFTPIVAIALVSGIFLNSRWLAIVNPLIVMAISDLFLSSYDWRLIAVVYSCFALMGLVGVVLRNRKSYWLAISGGVAGSVLFFLVTNFAVWFFGNWYTRDLAGLTQCYVLALPFFKNMILGDIFWVAMLYPLIQFFVERRLSILSPSFKKARG